MFSIDPTVCWLLVEWFLVGFTGALVPGSVLLVTITETSQNGWVGGESITLGHCCLEFLLISSLFLGLGAVWSSSLVLSVTPILGGAVLILFGLFIPQTLRKSPALLSPFSKATSIRTNKNNLGVIARGMSLGITTSSANPYFIIWWLSVGLAYITRILLYLPITYLNVLPAILLIFFVHILADIIWYSFIVLMVTKGIHLLTEKTYRRLLIVSSIVMILLGARFIGGGFLGF